MLIDDRGLVFVGRRTDTPIDAWQMPQGGIDADESPRAAALRELKEEVGTEKAEIIAESRDWLSYDLPHELSKKVWRGRFRGQRQKWFLCRFLGTDRDIRLDDHEHPEFDEWRWIEPELLPRYIVDFKRNLYEDVLREFRAYLPPR